MNAAEETSMRATRRSMLRGVVVLGLGALGGTAFAQQAVPTGKVGVVWLGQSAFKITSPAGKVIVTDPWLRQNPLTPPEYKQLDTFDKIDVLLVSHAHWDHFADAVELAQRYDTPIRAPGGLNQALATLGVLPAKLLPRMNKGGTITPVTGIKVTAVHAEHSSELVWHNPVTDKDETHFGGEPVGWIIELENGFRIYHAGDTAAFGDMRLIGERYKPDLALLPIGGNFTMDPADAAWAVTNLIKPRAVIPMHYGANPLAKGTAKEFVEAMGESAIKVIVAVPGRLIEF